MPHKIGIMQPLPPIPAVRTIDEVLDAIETIIDWSLMNESRLGYFAALYKRITLSIRKNLPNFQDPARMERLDVVFASRYFDALNGWFHPAQAPPVTHGWRVAFQAAPLARPIIVQHLIAGVTPHIGLDLGVAAVTVSPGKELPSLASDFDLINQVLANEVKGVLDELDSLSPVMAEVYDVFAKFETRAIDVMLDFTRADAWAFAIQLALLDAEAQQAAIAERDMLIANTAAKIVSPPGLLAKMFEAVWLLESHNVTKIIEALNAQAEAVR
jgi:hypothetical protein